MADVKELNINSTTYDIKAKSVVDNNSGAVKFWTGTKAQYDAIVTKDSKTQYTCTDTGEMYLGNVQIGGGGGGASRNIGEIVASTMPLTDAGLHLLDGALISGSGSYSDFVDYIADLYDSGDYTAIFETEANWQSAVTTYGVCGKFVYDSVNNTVRLPKYNSKIYTGGGNAPVIGTNKSIGLTDGAVNAALVGNGTGNIGWQSAAYGNNIGDGTYAFSYGVNGYKPVGLVADGTKSGVIADLANITTSLDGYYYIVIATTEKTEIEVDIDDIATDLNGKADVDLTNINASQSAKNTIIGWEMPDYSAGITTTSPYTAPCAGLFLYKCFFTGGSYTIAINGNTVYDSFSGGGHMLPTYQIYVDKNDIITYTISNDQPLTAFYPLKGAN